MDTLIQDIRYGLRTLRRNWGFSATVLATVGLGAGCATAVFTFVDVLILRELPVHAPQEIYSVGSPGKDLDLNPSYYSHDLYHHLRGSSSMFSNLVASSVAVTSGVNLTEDLTTDRVRVELVSGNYFDVFGVSPAQGRFFEPAEDASPGASPVAVMSHEYWQRRFGGAAAALGETVRLNGSLFTIVGVAKAEFFGTRPGYAPDLWCPIMMVGHLSDGIRANARDQNYLEFFVRLPREVAPGPATAALNVAFQRWLDAPGLSNLSAQERARRVRPSLDLRPSSRGLSLLRGRLGGPLTMLMAAVALLLLVACTNVATLLLARAAARGREIAVRLSVGAGRARIVRQLVTESILLGLFGGGVGWLIANGMCRALVTFLPDNADAGQFAPDGRVLLFAILLSVMTGVLFGLIPALLASKTDLVSAVKVGPFPPTGRAGRFEMRDLLSAVQVALALVLITGAGLFSRTLSNLRSVDMGFRQTNLLLAFVDPQKSGYRGQRLLNFYEDVERRVLEQPGVVDVGWASHGTLSDVLPSGTRFINMSMHTEGQAQGTPDSMTTYISFVSSGYFTAAGLPVFQGRDFGPQDIAGGVEAAIINRAAARHWFGDSNPIGRRIGRGVSGPANLVVVGVVGDAKYRAVREETLRIVYLALSQSPHSPMALHLRTRGNAARLVPYVREAVRGADPQVPLFQVETVEERVDQALSQERLVATLANLLGGIATLLAAIGLYGVISYSVTQRVAEIGIRFALGARSGHVLFFFVRRALIVAAIGLAAGLPLTLASTRLLTALLYGITPADPATIGGAAGLLAATAIVSSAVPALRAAKIDPWHTLRHS